MHAYSDPSRAEQPHALPDVEVFYLSRATIRREQWLDPNSEPYTEGYYYWFCLPGCLPDSVPSGPFDTEEAALGDAQANNDSD
jgi:hypothetical protein